MRTVALAVALVAAGCGGDTGTDELEGTGMVLEDRNHGPELCLGGIVMTSDPVQCRGLALVGWDWDAIDGEQSRLGTTTAMAQVRGRLEGNVFTLTERPRPGGRVVTLDLPPNDISPACEKPDGDPAAPRAAWFDTRGTDHPDVVAAWVSDPAGPWEGPFTGSYLVRPGAVAAVTALVRHHYAGPLCVVERDQPTMKELAGVLERLGAVVGQTIWSGYADDRRGVVRALVTYVDDATRRRVEREFGTGRVHLVGALAPVG